MSRLSTIKNQIEGQRAKIKATLSGLSTRKFLDKDVAKVRAFIVKERKEIERLQKQIPVELKKFKKFVDGQKKELRKMMQTLTKRKPVRTRKKSSSTQTQASSKS